MQTFTGCTTEFDRDSIPWCSTRYKMSLKKVVNFLIFKKNLKIKTTPRTDGGWNHIAGGGHWGYCSSSCAEVHTTPPQRPTTPPVTPPVLNTGESLETTYCRGIWISNLMESSIALKPIKKPSFYALICEPLHQPQGLPEGGGGEDCLEYPVICGLHQ